MLPTLLPPTPTLESFVRLAREADLVPVAREIPFDTETAVSAYHKLADPPFGFLLESVVGGETWARYTFLGSSPREAWRLTGDRMDHWTPGGGWQTGEPLPDPLAEVQRLAARFRPAAVPGLPRFWGGLVGFLGYDMVRFMEHLPHAPAAWGNLPDALLMSTGVVVAIDNLFNRAHVIAAVETSAATEAELHRRYHVALEEIDLAIERLRSRAGPPPLALSAPPGEDPPFRSNQAREQFEAAVERVREYILAGDAFQVVLSQRLSMDAHGVAPFTLYRALRTLNPSPYLFFLDLDGFQLVGSSPEVLVRVEDERVVVRPIAGTRRRGRTPAEDAALAEDLLGDAKEVAEHLMLLDLGRNDVGRVAQFGTVHVPVRMAVERYSHVLHLVSSVEGRLRPGLSAMDVLRATFPAGTVSGAPKVRAMQIIDELEPTRRGPYAGAVGYIAHGGAAMDMAIAIRTMLLAAGEAHVQAGAGLVADSVPAAEYEETLNKARALLRALQMVRPPPLAAAAATHPCKTAR